MFALTAVPIELEALRADLQEPSAGAFVSFEGWVRDTDEGKRVARLEYEAYGELAISEGNRIILEAIEKFSILRAVCRHRVGVLQIGEVAVWVGVAAVHRGDAFLACQYIIDEVKRRVPIWKREQYADGTVEWVNCAHNSEAHKHEHAG